MSMEKSFQIFIKQLSETYDYESSVCDKSVVISIGWIPLFLRYIDGIAYIGVQANGMFFVANLIENNIDINGVDKGKMEEVGCIRNVFYSYCGI